MPGMSPRDEALHQQLREEQERERRRAAAEQRMNEHEREARILMAQAEKGDRDTASEKRPASRKGTEDGRLEREVRNVRKHGLKNSYDALQRIQGRGNRLRDDMPPSRLPQRSSVGGGMMRIGGPESAYHRPAAGSAAQAGGGAATAGYSSTKSINVPRSKPVRDRQAPDPTASKQESRPVTQDDKRDYYKRWMTNKAGPRREPPPSLPSEKEQTKARVRETVEQLLKKREQPDWTLPKAARPQSGLEAGSGVPSYDPKEPRHRKTLNQLKEKRKKKGKWGVKTDERGVHMYMDF